MTSETAVATVVSLAANGRVSVEVDAAAVCARCAAGRGCGAGLFGRQRGVRRLDAAIAPGLDPAVGERVVLALDSAGLLGAAKLVYGMPLAGATGGAALAYLTGVGELAAVVAAAAGLATGFGLARRRLARAGCLDGLHPVVTGCDYPD